MAHGHHRRRLFLGDAKAWPRTGSSLRRRALLPRQLHRFSSGGAISIREGGHISSCASTWIHGALSCADRTRVDPIEALCVLLFRLSFPARYDRMLKWFGRSPSALCAIYHRVLNLIYERHTHLFDFFAAELDIRGRFESLCGRVYSIRGSFGQCILRARTLSFRFVKLPI